MSELAMAQVDAVEVTVLERHTYVFPEPDSYCSAHQQQLCLRCARNPSTCDSNHPRSGDCEIYAVTGMHDETCPNRVRG